MRGGGLRALAAALQGIRESAPAAAAALQAEEHAPLVGHMASVLLQARSCACLKMLGDLSAL